jgi:DNA mismatch repair protein MutS2
VSIQKPVAKPAKNEIHLRRLTVDNALIKLDRFLNRAFMEGMEQIRVIHGRGTGVLRDAGREQLDKHPLVKSYRPAVYGEGGGGVTIVQVARR